MIVAGHTPASPLASEKRVLIVEDELALRHGMHRYLTAQGLSVETVDGCEAAVARCMTHPPNALVLDLRLPDGDAFALLHRLRDAHAEVPFVLVTAHASVELAVRAMREGAEDVLTKPVQLPQLYGVLSRMLEPERDDGAKRAALVRGSSRCMRAVRPTSAPLFVGTSRAARELSDMAEKVAEVDRPVLVLGETGSGKTMLARWIHRRSRRATAPFVELNCAGLSKELVENELFGHERGAYTGAQVEKIGLVEAAHQGTLFLDEVGDLDASVQPKLLKVLEDQRFRRVGDVRERSIDIRIVAATQHDLSRAVRERVFRSDLYYRLSTITLHVPSLRERREDIPLLARAIVDSLARDEQPLEIAEDAYDKLSAHDWPGNVRELKNVLERAVLFVRGPSLRADDVRFDAAACCADTRPPPCDTSLTLDGMERRYIEAVLREEEGHVERASQRLGIPRSTLYQKLKRYRTPCCEESEHGDVAPPSRRNP